MKTTTQGSVSLPKSLVIRKGEIIQSDEFVAFVTAQKRLQEQIDNNWDMFQELMEKKNVATVKGNWGHITLATRKTLRATEPLPPRFYKQVLDTSKLNAYRVMKGDYPEGVRETTSKYLSKKVLI
jgi:hypothetical protein